VANVDDVVLSTHRASAAQRRVSVCCQALRTTSEARYSKKEEMLTLECVLMACMIDGKGEMRFDCLL
jgi:hypothetical protein